MTDTLLATATGRLFIGGEWRESSSGERHDVVTPATGEKIADVAWATVDDVDAAAAAARASFESGVWSGLSGRERARVLIRIAALIRERSEELAQAESADVGKPILFARVVDVPTAAETFEYYAALAQTGEGALRDTTLPAFQYTVREPIGVVGALTPFNFPLILTASKIAPALAAGNSIVHKPAEDTPLSAVILAQIFADAGLPDGVYNLITGVGPALGERIVEHPEIDMIAFTGSTAVGSKVAAKAGELLKPVMVELGGNGANVVFADADIDSAVNATINAFVFNSGQFCMAGVRLLVQRELHDTFLQILSQAVPQVPIGRIDDMGTIIGPLVSQRHLDRVSGFVERAKAQGGTVVTGGERVDLDGGYYFSPTIITGLPNDAEAVQEEVFGPVLTVQTFDTEEEAIALANSTRYGLAMGIQTSDIVKAMRVSKKLEAGLIWVNEWGKLDPTLTFGGVKNSGYGRENGPEALHHYTRTKSVVISTPAPAPAAPSAP
ncbi:aldehyde dehydrogenase family protein [Microbacterium sp.]|uniref:aldehyde dehydrogenase family protein n=1 Tax=Microbacterium sp. TaxID=51671 RepID=UPI002C202B99|nr:aldehyde dehydrogenase family protein [Microbacterium sp.]HWL76377.1 aldehyde dehydrogenase family protein [Microbacterium sp.]